jgi:chromosome segregation ATPase
MDLPNRSLEEEKGLAGKDMSLNLDPSNRSLEEQQEGLPELQARVSELKTALGSSKQELVLKDKQLDQSKGALRGHTTVRQAAQVEQEKANAELLSATNELQRMKDENATLTFQLETTNCKAEERTSTIERHNSQLDIDTKQLSTLQSKLEKL